MQATQLYANPNQTGSIAAQAVQYGVPINSAIQQAGFQATSAADVTTTQPCYGDPEHCHPAGQGIQVSAIPGDIASAVVSAIVTPVETFVQNAFPRIGLFLLALILTIVGVLLLVKQ